MASILFLTFILSPYGLASEHWGVKIISALIFIGSSLALLWMSNPKEIRAIKKRFTHRPRKRNRF